MMNWVVESHQVEIDSDDAIFISRTAQQLFNIFKNHVQFLGWRDGCLASTELVKIAFAGFRANRIRPYFRAESHIRYEAAELYSGFIQIRLGIAVWCEGNDDFMLWYIHNECKDSKKKWKVIRLSEKKFVPLWLLYELMFA